MNEIASLVRRRLHGEQIALLRHLGRRALHSHGIAGVSLSKAERAIAVKLWRRGLVNIWFRKVPSNQPSLQGPFFAPSHVGMRLAEQCLYPSQRSEEGET